MITVASVLGPQLPSIISKERKKERRKADRQAHSEWPGALGQLTQKTE